MNNKAYQSIGTDMTLPPCPSCGGHPIFIVARLRLGNDDEIRKYSYAHCPCDDSVVGWHVGRTMCDAVARVQRAWARKEFISMKKLVEIDE